MLKAIWPNVVSAVSFIGIIVGAMTTGASYYLGLTGVVGVAVAITGAVLNGRDFSRSVKVFGNQKPELRKHKIAEYMHNLIAGSGSIAIFTRDMSWATPAIKGELREKAASKHLTIIMQRPTDLSRDLEAAGADVFYYGALLHDEAMVSRFTLIDAGSHSAELAIGQTKEGVHTIHRYSKASDHALGLAKDMLTLLKPALASNASVPSSSPKSRE
ncbi:hypothetical protein NNX28_08510 [Arthrobacter sp. zg-Y859]|uniref:Uncharacterized protein n=1 Tax=Arthrobacter jinronghuae TaxID=2964609 RepID=A0ABT1NQU8_9MICC|nr:hypothetical protein [Arthrobacter jinronghuae]MCQ1949966.1 hypothetical protein [Arthrobacter jinronghuae]UWX80112.1 hypothetical protein N2K98_08000 [Arthrobacter jinronghuae]